MKQQRPSGSIDSFSVFLKTVNKHSASADLDQGGFSGQAATAAAAAAAAAAASTAANGRPWRKMVTVLADRGAVPVPDLMKESGLGFSEFSAALQDATKHEMIQIRAGEGTEVAELTAFGQKLASLE